MKCFDCAALGRTAAAAAVCVDCGAAVCPGHSRTEPRWLTRTAAINRTVRVDTPARSIRCGLCQQARDASAGYRPSEARK